MKISWVKGSDGHGAGHPEPNRCRTAWNRTRNRNVRDRFHTGPNRETAEKKLSKSWNRRKKPFEPDQRTAGKFTRSEPIHPDQRCNGTTPEPETGPERFTRPNCSLEPDPEPYCYPGLKNYINFKRFPFLARLSESDVWCTVGKPLKSSFQCRKSCIIEIVLSKVIVKRVDMYQIST